MKLWAVRANVVDYDHEWNFGAEVDPGKKEEGIALEFTYGPPAPTKFLEF